MSQNQNPLQQFMQGVQNFQNNPIVSGTENIINKVTDPFGVQDWIRQNPQKAAAIAAAAAPLIAAPFTMGGSLAAEPEALAGVGAVEGATALGEAGAEGAATAGETAGMTPEALSFKTGQPIIKEVSPINPANPVKAFQPVNGGPKFYGDPEAMGLQADPQNPGMYQDQGGNIYHGSELPVKPQPIAQGTTPQSGGNIITNTAKWMGNAPGWVKTGATVLGINELPKLLPDVSKLIAIGTAIGASKMNGGPTTANASSPTNGKPTYTMDSPLDSGQVMSDQAFATQSGALQKQIDNAKLNDPNQANALQGQLDQLHTTYSAQQPLRDAWTKMNTVLSLSNNTASDLGSAPASILAANPTYDQLLKADNGKYAKLANDLQTLGNTVGVNLFAYKSPDAIKGAIDSIVQSGKTQYGSIQTTYSGQGNQTSGNQQTIAPTMAPQPAPMQSQGTGYGQLPASFGLNGQNMPPVNIPAPSIPALPSGGGFYQNIY